MMCLKQVNVDLVGPVWLRNGFKFKELQLIGYLQKVNCKKKLKNIGKMVSFSV